MTSSNLISHVCETRKFVMALLHGNKGCYMIKIGPVSPRGFNRLICVRYLLWTYEAFLYSARLAIFLVLLPQYYHLSSFKANDFPLLLREINFPHFIAFPYKINTCQKCSGEFSLSFNYANISMQYHP